MKIIIILGILSLSIFCQNYTLNIQKIDTLACNDYIRSKNTIEQNREFLKKRNILIKKNSTFNAEELDLIVEAVYLYPPYLFKNNFILKDTIYLEYKDKVMARTHKYTKLSNGSRKFEQVLVEAMARAIDDIEGRITIELGGMWRRSSYKSRVYTIFHELAHILNYDYTTSFINLNGGWYNNYFGKRLNPKDRSKFVSHYAQSNSSEDWAESVSAYRLNPKLLKSKSIEKYNYIKEKVFLGADYLSQDLCEKTAIRQPDRISERAKKHIEFAINHRRVYRSLKKEKKGKLNKKALIYKMMDQYFNHIIYRSWDKKAYLNNYRDALDTMLELNSTEKSIIDDYFSTLDSKFIQKILN